MKSVYMAGSIAGKMYDECVEWREELRRNLHPFYFTILSPMRNKEFLKGKKCGHCHDEHLMARVDVIIARDMHDVRTCDVFVMNIDPEDPVSVGSCVEYGLALANPNIIKVVICDSPASIHPFIMNTSDVVAGTVGEAAEFINSLRP